jgi:UDP-2,3-diacylglucosamine pyrophosphatase LpxH
MADVVYDAIEVSDVHLGLPSCNAAEFTMLVRAIISGELRTEQFIVDGDLFDSRNFENWRSEDWEALDAVRDLVDQGIVLVVFIEGNHDGPPKTIRVLTNFKMRKCHSVGNVLILHGHEFDTFLNRHPTVTRIADAAYRAMQKIHPAAANWIKDRFVGLADHAADVERGATKAAIEGGYSIVIAGHTHIPRDGQGLGYYNAGGWVSGRPHWISIKAGKVELHTI